MLEDDARDSLIISLYDSILDPGQTPATLARLDQWLGSDGLHLIGWHQTLDMPTLSQATGRLAAHVNTYTRELRAIDPRMDAAMRQPVGTVFHCHEHFDNRFVARDTFYQDYQIKMIGMRYIMGGRLYSHADEDVFMVFNHEVGKSPFQPAQQQAVKQLMPHLSAWFRQWRHTEALRCAAWAGEQGLEAMEQGVALLSHNRKLLYMNPTAERYFPAQPGSGKRHNKLAAHAGMNEAILRVQRSRQAECLQIASPDDGQESVVVHILPFPREGIGAGMIKPGFTSQKEASAIRAGERPPGLVLHAQGDILLLIRPRKRQLLASAANLTQLFGLTVAESRLAHALAKGNSAEQYAQLNSLSPATVRSQIRAILQKTGEDNLQNLLRLLVALPAI